MGEFWSTIKTYLDADSLAVIVSAIALVTATRISKKQNRSARVQQFESIFFHMINLHHVIVSQLQGGRSFFDMTVGKINNLRIVVTPPKHDGYGGLTPAEIREAKDKSEAKKIMKERYAPEYYNKVENDLNHYFRNLYQILKLVNTSTLIRDKDRDQYAGILRAQLSQNELHTLMYNAMNEGYGYPKAMYLIQKYDMLQNMGKSDIHKAFLELYDDTASTIIIDFGKVFKEENKLSKTRRAQFKY